MKLSLLTVLALPLLLSSALSGQTGPAASPAAATPCPRFAAGTDLVEPQNLFSSHGLLRVSFSYTTRVDESGNTLFCFMTPDGAQSPTLHVRPGDELMISLKNDLPPADPMTGMHGMKGMAMAHPPSPQPPGIEVSGAPSRNCNSMTMTATSTNMHFHGANVAPVCHQDEVLKTLINSGESFEYDIHFPLNEPPGLYWYHPHIHGSSEAAVQGGASGAIIVEGLQNVVPEIAGLPEQLLIVRDNLVPSDSNSSATTDATREAEDQADPPAWDLSLNYAPVAFPKYTPVTLPMAPRQKQFWRVLNASADTILDLQLQYDGVAQPLRIVALDGVPVDSQDGVTGGHPYNRNHLLIPPAGRAEFIVTGPAAKVKVARLVTLNVETGPLGDNDPERPLMAITTTPSITTSSAAASLVTTPSVDGAPVAAPRFAGLRSAAPTVHRTIYFSEIVSDPSDPESPTNFFITVDGQTPVLFSPDNPPAITTTQGAVEDWTIENRAGENHEFHIHQIHFLVLEKNHVPEEGQYLDTINVPFWSGSGPYPSVKLRMDFRGPVVGDFVYHCHILGHEDNGMMAIIRVLPRR